MKTRLICWITIACIVFLAVVAHQPKTIKTTTIQITCPQTKPVCVKLPPTGALPNNQ